MELNRREFLAGAIAMAAQSAEGPMLVDNPKGNYRFIRGSAPFSSGAAAMKGYEVVHATLAPAPAYRKGFEAIDRHLKQQGRPPQALCGIELRSPKPFTFGGFDDFNQGYIEELKKRSIHVDGLNPVARTNVAPALEPPGEVHMYGFSFTAPAPAAGPTFVVAGAGEVRADRRGPEGIIRRGDVSPDGMREKAIFVLGLMDDRLRELSVAWNRVTTVEVYTVQNVFPMMQNLLLPRLGAAKNHGIRWHFARPPIEELEFEMDVRGCRRELVIS